MYATEKKQPLPVVKGGMKRTLRMMNGGHMKEAPLCMEDGGSALEDRLNRNLRTGGLTIRAAGMLADIENSRRTDATQRYGVDAQLANAARQNDTARYQIDSQAVSAMRNGNAATGPTRNLMTNNAPPNTANIGGQNAAVKAPISKSPIINKDGTTIATDGTSSSIVTPTAVDNSASPPSGPPVSTASRTYDDPVQMKQGGTLRTGMGGMVPYRGRGKGDKHPALYEEGEVVASNAMLKAEPGLKEHLMGLREQVLAAKGMTPEEADMKALSGGTLRAVDGDLSEAIKRARERNPTWIPAPEGTQNWTTTPGANPSGKGTINYNTAPAITPLEAELSPVRNANVAGEITRPGNRPAPPPAALAVDAVDTVPPGNRVALTSDPGRTLRGNEVALTRDVGSNGYRPNFAEPNPRPAAAMGSTPEEQFARNQAAARKAARNAGAAPNPGAAAAAAAAEPSPLRQGAQQMFGSKEEWKKFGDTLTKERSIPGMKMVGNVMKWAAAPLSAYETYQDIKKGDTGNAALHAADTAAGGALFTPALPAAAAYLGARTAYEAPQQIKDALGESRMDTLGGVINQIGLKSGMWGTDDSTMLQQRADATVNRGAAQTRPNQLQASVPEAGDMGARDRSRFTGAHAPAQVAANAADEARANDLRGYVKAHDDRAPGGNLPVMPQSLRDTGNIYKVIDKNGNVSYSGGIVKDGAKFINNDGNEFEPAGGVVFPNRSQPSLRIPDGNELNYLKHLETVNQNKFDRQKALHTASLAERGAAVTEGAARDTHSDRVHAQSLEVYKNRFKNEKGERDEFAEKRALDVSNMLTKGAFGLKPREDRAKHDQDVGDLTDMFLQIERPRSVGTDRALDMIGLGEKRPSLSAMPNFKGGTFKRIGANVTLGKGRNDYELTDNKGKKHYMSNMNDNQLLLLAEMGATPGDDKN